MSTTTTESLSCGGGSSSNGGTCCGGGTQDALTERKLKLTPMEYRVTQERQTERPFSNKYNKHFEPGSYHCIVCETELFRSDTKFESKSGWPAFYNVVDSKRVKLTPDLSHVGANLLLLVAKPDLARTEVSCANCNAHLGHLFKDGPKPTGLRYCINSSSLTFYPSDGKSSENNCDKVDVVVNGSATSSTDAKERLTRAPCLNLSGQEKICFFQSHPPASTTPVNPDVTSNSVTSRAKPPKSLMVNSSSSGCLGSKNRRTSDTNANSIVRRRISFFSTPPSPSRPIERISIPPKTFILRETPL